MEVAIWSVGDPADRVEVAANYFHFAERGFWAFAGDGENPSEILENLKVTDVFFFGVRQQLVKGVNDWN